MLLRTLFASAMTFACAASAETPSETIGEPQAVLSGASENLPQAPWQIGSGFMTYWGGEDPLINILAVNPAKDAWPADVFDRQTQTFLKLPPGAADMSIGLLRNGARYNPDFYTGDYIIEWDGDGRLGTGLKGGEGWEEREGPNRIRETYDGSRAGWASAQIRQVGAGGISNIRIYRAEHEAALKAGKIFNPAFVQHIARYDIVRTMDWNAARVTRADQIPDINTQFWGGVIVPIEAQFKLAQEAGVALWLNAPGRLGAPDGLNARLDAIADQKARIALIAEAFDTVAASPEWDNYAALIVAAMEATDYPLDRPFYLELANETWNWGGPFGYATEWYWGLTGGLSARTGNKYAGNPNRGAYGYFSARLAEALAKALGAAGRADQPWTMVIGTQTAWDQHTLGPLQGVRDYGGGENKQPMARYGVAATGYYRGGFHDAGGALFGPGVKGAAWRAAWLRRLDDDPEALAQYLYDYIADPTPRKQNIAWVVAQSKRHQEIAESFGARFLGQYEGSSHDSLDRELAKNAEALAFYKAWQSGPHHAAVIRLQAEKMRAAFPGGPGGGDPGVILSNFQHWSNEGVNPKGPWIFNTLWGEETEAEKALFEVVGEE